VGMFLKQSTAIDISMGPFVDSTNGNTVEDALTITQPDIRLKKNGGAWAQKNAAQTLSHEENGWYEVALDATDTNTVGNLLVAIHESGALPVWREFQVLPANVYDSLIGGTDALQVHANEITAGLITAAAIATGAIDADAIAADAITAAKVAADVHAEAADAVWDEAAAGHVAAGSFGEQCGTDIDAILVDTGTTLQGEVDGIQADTEDIQSRLPATLDGGNMRSQVKDIDAGVVDVVAAPTLDAAVSSRLATASYTTPPTVAQIRTEMDSNSADLNTIIAALAALTVPTADENADALLDRASAIDGYTVREIMRVLAAALAGKSSGGASDDAVRAIDDSKGRITATVDANGHRTAVTVDAT